ncbi:hypothetical protein F5B21DRAFT_17919 [Xylaria acuta]|nr:hypothetical protein F5B21DRAFT_17919 [Xylaria acuta]
MVLKQGKNGKKRRQKRTTPGIRWSSPTQLLIWRSLAYQWQSRRDAEFSRGYGRTWECWPLSWIIYVQPLTGPGLGHSCLPQCGRFVISTSTSLSDEAYPICNEEAARTPQQGIPLRKDVVTRDEVETGT